MPAIAARECFDTSSAAHPASGAGPWFYRPGRKTRPDFRLYCFPYAGESSTVFRSWASRVPDEVEVVGVELPGRGARIREAPVADLDRLARGAADAIAGQAASRFAFFGHSMGALLAYEVTRRLRSRGACQPCHIFASGCRAPHLRSDRRAVGSMSDNEFLESLRELNGTPEPVLRNAELMELLFPVLRADFTAVDTWTFRTERALNVPITAIGGRSDPHVGLDAVRAWQEHTRQEFQFRTFPGDHFFIQSNEPELLEMILNTLRNESWI